MLKFSRAKLLIMTAVSFGVLISCGNPSAEVSSTAPPAKPLLPGLTQTLPRADSSTLVVVDNIGPVSNPGAQKYVQVSGDKPFAITGWAVDEPTKTAAGGVDVVIDQKPYNARYGTPRGDVSQHFNQPAYANCGFELPIAPGQLAKGQHSASIRVLTADKKSYYQGPVIQFEVN